MSVEEDGCRIYDYLGINYPSGKWRHNSIVRGADEQILEPIES